MIPMLSVKTFIVIYINFNAEITQMFSHRTIMKNHFLLETYHLTSFIFTYHLPRLNAKTGWYNKMRWLHHMLSLTGYQLWRILFSHVDWYLSAQSWE